MFLGQKNKKKKTVLPIILREIVVAHMQVHTNCTSNELTN